jgi:hypothetical protein
VLHGAENAGDVGDEVEVGPGKACVLGARIRERDGDLGVDAAGIGGEDDDAVGQEDGLGDAVGDEEGGPLGLLADGEQFLVEVLAGRRGSRASARARETRIFWPPLSWRG